MNILFLSSWKTNSKISKNTSIIKDHLKILLINWCKVLKINQFYNYKRVTNYILLGIFEIRVDLHFGMIHKHFSSHNLNSFANDCFL